MKKLRYAAFLLFVCSTLFALRANLHAEINFVTYTIAGPCDQRFMLWQVQTTEGECPNDESGFAQACSNFCANWGLQGDGSCNQYEGGEGTGLCACGYWNECANQGCGDFGSPCGGAGDSPCCTGLNCYLTSVFGGDCR